ncbi:hypothetical protein MMC06_000544 [Schaereria dolodes]|nr:hypothetical protein [Schaereria dolodes]
MGNVFMYMIIPLSTLLILRYLYARHLSDGIETSWSEEMKKRRAVSVKFSENSVPHDMKDHNQKVAAIVEAMRSFYNRKQAFRVYHGSTNSTRLVNFDRTKIIDISSLSDVLSIDAEEKTALVETNVPMDVLVDATLKYGLVPAVVPEFPGITVGGSFSGTAGESSSFKYGFFDRTVKWCNIILSNGEIVKASATSNSDLFYGAAGSFGTLGVTTLFEIQLIPAGTYVELTYFPVTSVAEAITAIKRASKDSYNYIDGILYSLNHGVIILGHLTDHTTHRVQRFTRAHDPWFYLHAAKAGSTTEAVPLQDYLFRYDRGAFWMGAYSFHMFWTPFNRLTRWFVDPLMHTRKLYQALHASGHAQKFMIQDLALPHETAEPFIDYVSREFGIFPLWLCPLRPDSEAPMHSRYPAATDLLINVGVWGPRWGDFEDFQKENRALEKKVTELEGLKWLYAHAYYTEEEFWKIYGRDWYEALRAKYHAQTLPNIYDKVKPAEGYKAPSELKGLLMALFGKATLLKK